MEVTGRCVLSSIAPQGPHRPPVQRVSGPAVAAVPAFRERAVPPCCQSNGKGSSAMNSTPQVETVEISDAELDNVSGGLSVRPRHRHRLLDGVAPVAGPVDTRRRHRRGCHRPEHRPGHQPGRRSLTAPRAPSPGAAPPVPGLTGAVVLSPVRAARTVFPPVAAPAGPSTSAGEGQVPCSSASRPSPGSVARGARPPGAFRPPAGLAGAVCDAGRRWRPPLCGR